MKKKKISIHDLAKELNVSSATVSFVLNGKAQEKRISSAMETRILKYAEKSGYEPNQAAKTLRTGKSKLIGMLVEGISDPFFSSIARNVEESLREHNYRIFYSSTNNDAVVARELIRQYRAAQVDAFIIAPPQNIEGTVKGLIDDGYPVVLFDRFIYGLATHNVVVDNFHGAYSAILHFYENGYRDIGLVTLRSTQVQMDDRLKGYEKAMSERLLEPKVLKLAYNLRDEQIVEEITSFLSRPERPEALLFATNYLAVNGLRAIQEMGLEIPRHIAVIGFDDNSHFSLFAPAITAVAQPIDGISREVVKHLMNFLEDEKRFYPPVTTILPTKLIVRESSLAGKKNLENRSVKKI